MKRQHVFVCALTALLLALLLLLAVARRHQSPARDKASIEILCTTFPIHQITRNVAQGRDGARIELLLPAQIGCPHHYSLTPQDMRKLAQADILVVNGLGLEDFLGSPVFKANPNLTMINSSNGIGDLLRYSDDDAPHDDHAQADDDDHATATHQQCDHGHDHDHDQCDHQDSGLNPHLFASPRQVGRLAMSIAEALAAHDPEWAAVYIANARAYAQRMDSLALAFAELGQRLRNNRIIQPHGVFDYLARDMGLDIVAVIQPHGQEPAAADMLELVTLIRAKDVGAIVVEPQYPDRVGRTLARETGIIVARLDPGASGPDHAPPDYLETLMRHNLETLEEALGAR